MANSASTRPSLLQVLVPLGVALAAILGCLFLAYGLNVGNPSKPELATVEVTCSPDVVRAQVGDVVTYVVTISNENPDGEVDVLSVRDTVLGDLSYAFASRLAAGASDRAVFTHTVLIDDPDPLVNTVTVSVAGVGAVGEATASAEVDLLRPAVGIEVAVTPDAARRGEEVVTSITVSNLGDVVLRPITVTDSLRSDLTSSFSEALDPGASRGQSFAWVVPADASGPLTRTVTVRAATDAGEIVSDSATVLIDVLRPALQVEAGVSPPAAVPGETVTLTVSVENGGQVDLEGIDVSDSLEGDLSASFDPTLAAGASQERAFPWTIRPNQTLPLTRTVTVRADASGEAVTATAVAVVDRLRPVLRIEPSVAPPAVIRGRAAVVTMTAINAGELDVGGLRVEDSILGDLSRLFPRTLPAGASHSESIPWSSRPDDAGPLTRRVTVSGEGAGEGVSETAELSLSLLGVEASTSGPALVRAGERIAPSVTITNTGSEGAPDLILESVADGGRDLSVPDACRTLTSGAACTFSYEFTVPADEETAEAVVDVRYRPEGLDEVVSTTAEVTMAVILPWERGTGTPEGVEVRTVAVCPADPRVLYAGFGSRGQGVYRSTDAGVSWEPTAFQVQEVFDVAIDPQDCDTVYAGAWRDGVRKSTDGGRSWEAAGDGLAGAFVYAVVIDPTDSTVLYVGTAERGAYRSDDAGATWEAWGGGAATVTDLAVGPEGRVVYAATWGSGVVRRERGSTGWEAWESLNEGIPDAHRQVYAVTVDLTDPSRVFAATAAGGVYRSGDGGGTWEQVFSSPRTAYALAVDPETAVVYAGTANGVVVSASNGDPGSWEMFDVGMEGLAARALALGSGEAGHIHVGSADGAWRHTYPRRP